MKSFIFCTSYIGRYQRDRSLSRYSKWCNYYIPRAKEFGASHVFLIDDGTPLPRLKKLKIPIINAEGPLPKTLPGKAVIFRFPKRYGRSSISVYPGWWRSFSFSSQLAKHYGFDKVIHVESDAYVLSPRMAKALSRINKGWNVLWCPRWKFPECSIQIIGKDSIAALNQYWKAGKKFWFKKRNNSEFAERILPFTNIIKSFKGDRFGEYRRTVPVNADFVCQAVSPMRFDRFLRNKLKSASE
jgi:hypothetical protein